MLISDDIDRYVRFCGLEWVVKGFWSAPGKNYFSNKNVWVDAYGRLHLTICQRKGVWYCASLQTEYSFGYGRYIFYISSRFDQFPENVVLGLFTYEDDRREIDIELRKKKETEGAFLVQPPTSEQPEYSFRAPLNGSHTTHRFKLQRDRVTFQSIHGHYRSAPSKRHLIAEWVEDKKPIPSPDGMRLHMNLWLKRGMAPYPARDTEAVINRFEFIPL